MATPMPRPERTMGNELPTIDQYLEMEGLSADKREYVSGTLRALAGASLTHNQITGNIYVELWHAAQDGSCRVYVLDAKLKAADDVIYYPDLMVACGPKGDNPLIEDSPCLVVEVLSPGSRAIDLGEKLLVYKRMPSVKTYLVVHQDGRRVERFARHDTDVWRHTDITGSEAFRIPCPTTELALDQIYRGTDVTA